MYGGATQTHRKPVDGSPGLDNPNRDVVCNASHSPFVEIPFDFSDTNVYDLSKWDALWE